MQILTTNHYSIRTKRPTSSATSSRSMTIWKGIDGSDKEVPSEEGRFDSKGLSTCKNAKRESHDHQERGGLFFMEVKDS